MSDLVCERCGIARSFADAMIADREKSCDGRTHEWVKPMHNSVDIVIG